MTLEDIVPVVVATNAVGHLIAEIHVLAILFDCAIDSVFDYIEQSVVIDFC